LKEPGAQTRSLAFIAPFGYHPPAKRTDRFALWNTTFKNRITR
jgi:hypothetical protein